jgi:hypothetical protein
MITAATHAVIFALIWTLTHKMIWRLTSRMEGLTPSSFTTNDSGASQKFNRNPGGREM